jgi:hypothetical protein
MPEWDEQPLPMNGTIPNPDLTTAVNRSMKSCSETNSTGVVDIEPFSGSPRTRTHEVTKERHHIYRGLWRGSISLMRRICSNGGGVKATAQEASRGEPPFDEAMDEFDRSRPKAVADVPTKLPAYGPVEDDSVALEPN